MVNTQAVLQVFLIFSYASDFSVKRFSSICTGHFISLQNSLRLYSVKPSEDIFHRCATFGSKLISVVNRVAWHCYSTSSCSQKFLRFLANRPMKRTPISVCISSDAVVSPPKSRTIGLGVSFEARKGQKTGL